MVGHSASSRRCCEIGKGGTIDGYFDPFASLSTPLLSTMAIHSLYAESTSSLGWAMGLTTIWVCPSKSA